MPTDRVIQLIDNPNYCVLTVRFSREVTGEEREVLDDNFRQGRLRTDPAKDLAGSVCEQFCNELQEAYDEYGGLVGHFLVEKVELGKDIQFPKQESPSADDSPQGDDVAVQ